MPKLSSVNNAILIAFIISFSLTAQELKSVVPGSAEAKWVGSSFDSLFIKAKVNLQKGSSVSSNIDIKKDSDAKLFVDHAQSVANDGMKMSESALRNHLTDLAIQYSNIAQVALSFAFYRTALVGIKQEAASDSILLSIVASKYLDYKYHNSKFENRARDVVGLLEKKGYNTLLDNKYVMEEFIDNGQMAEVFFKFIYISYNFYRNFYEMNKGQIWSPAFCKDKYYKYFVKLQQINATLHKELFRIQDVLYELNEIAKINDAIELTSIRNQLEANIKELKSLISAR